MVPLERRISQAVHFLTSNDSMQLKFDHLTSAYIVVLECRSNNNSYVGIQYNTVRKKHNIKGCGFDCQWPLPLVNSNWQHLSILRLVKRTLLNKCGIGFQTRRYICNTFINSLMYGCVA